MNKRLTIHGHKHVIAATTIVVSYLKTPEQGVRVGVTMTGIQLRNYSFNKMNESKKRPLINW